MKRSAIHLLVLLLALVVFAAPLEARERERPRGGTVRVRIVDNAFRPRRLTVDRGTTVRWVNNGSRSHTSTSNSNAWNSGTLSPGESFRRRFRRTGTFRYHCTIHASMTGRIIVS